MKIITRGIPTDPVYQCKCYHCLTEFQYYACEVIWSQTPNPFAMGSMFKNDVQSIKCPVCTVYNGVDPAPVTPIVI